MKNSSKTKSLLKPKYPIYFFFLLILFFWALHVWFLFFDPRIGNIFFSRLLFFVIAVFLSSAFVYVLVSPFLIFGKVSSNSMEPNFFEGDITLTTTLYFDSLAVGDVVDFSLPGCETKGFALQDGLIQLIWGHKKFFTKRLIGLPGDIVKIANGEIFVNNVSQKNNWQIKERVNYSLETTANIKRFIFYPGLEHCNIKIPDGYCFVLGDNVNSSYDSQSFGYLPLSRIVGRVIFCIPMNQKKRRDWKSESG